MRALPSSYSARLHPFFAVLEKAGTRLPQALERASLPVQLTERPDLRFSAPKVYCFLDDLERREGFQDLALAGALAERFNSIEPRFRLQLQSQGSLSACLDHYFILMQAYNGRIGAKIHEGERTRIAASADPSYASARWNRFADWSNLLVLVAIVRHVLGPNWAPEEMTLQARTEVSDFARARFPQTRILTGQPLTSMTIATPFLATKMWASSYRIAANDSGGGPRLPKSFPEVMTELLRPYLDHPKLSIHLAAEMAGTSVRTLQRRLHLFGLSYSDLVERARYQGALQLLADPGAKIIDVAYALGYEHPSHFSRAFRRMSGMSPSAFRRSTG